jgi:FAD/FMN-containing dehydrogenase
LNLDNLTGITSIDPDRMNATILAGTRIRDIGAPLLERGLALANQGDIDVQAIAGAIGTGTHGTGRAFGSFSSTMIACDIVTATGDMLRVDESDLDLLRAARVSVGTLGVMVSVTLRVIPAYKLERTSFPVPYAETESRWNEVEPNSRNLEFWWVPPLDTSVFKVFTETDKPITGTPSANPNLQPGTIERYLPPDGVDWSWKVYPAVREWKFVEMEYFLPVARGFEAFDAVRDLMLSTWPQIRYSLEYRVQAGEDAFLSVTQGEVSAVVSVHDEADNIHWDFFRDVESLVYGKGGRPHWGKLSFLEPDAWKAAFPLVDRFIAIRRTVDPDGVFLNDWLRPVLE